MSWKTWTSAAVVAAIAAVSAAPAGAAPFAYVPQGVAGAVPVAQYDAGAGSLSPLSPPDVAGGVEPFAAVASPDGTALYVVNAGGVSMAGTVGQYTVAADGRLTPKTPSTVTAGDEPFDLAITPDGGTLYVLDAGMMQIRRYSVASSGPDAGELEPAPGGTAATGSLPESLAVSPDGRSLYVVNRVGNTLSQFDIGDDGALTPKTPATTALPADSRSIALSPDGSSAYVASASSLAHLRADAAGRLTPAGDVGLPALPNSSVAVAPDTGAVYVAVHDTAGLGDDIVQFSAGPSGAPVGMTRIDSAPDIREIGIAPDGDTLYAVGWSGPEGDVTSHDVAADGKLTRRDTVATTNANPKTIALTPLADVRATATAEPGTVGGVVRYTVTAHNDGPSGAPGVTTSLTLPAETTFLSSSATQGTCAGTTCELGVIPSGGSASATITARALQAGSFAASASVTPGPFDPSLGNQTAGAAATVTPAPRAVTSAASDVEQTAATLNGVVDPTGGATTYRFEYGTTTAYGRSTPATSAGSGDPVAVAATVADLQPSTRYHFRVVAVQGGVTVAGADRTFTTRAVPAPAPPTVVQPPATPVQPPAGGTPRATDEPKPAPRSLSLRLSPRADSRWPFRFRVSGRLALPRGVTRAAGCRGSVTVALRRESRTVASRRASVTRSCTFSARLTLGRSLRGKRGTLRVVVRFAGNEALGAMQARGATVRFGRR